MTTPERAREIVAEVDNRLAERPVPRRWFFAGVAVAFAIGVVIAFVIRAMKGTL